MSDGLEAPTQRGTASPETPQPTRDVIVETASRLFYREGIKAVSLDRVAEKARLTKKTIYYHFKSKDALIAACLEGRDQPNLNLFRQWFDDAPGDLADKVQTIFTRLSENARHPNWRGCGFLRTAAELANQPGHPAIRIGSDHKHKFERWLAREIGAVLGDEAQATALSRQILVLLDGAFSSALIHRDAGYFDAAGAAANALISFNRLRPGHLA